MKKSRYTEEQIAYVLRHPVLAAHRADIAAGIAFSQNPNDLLVGAGQPESAHEYLQIE